MLPPDFKLTRSGGIVEPIDLPTAKNFLRTRISTADDALIAIWITTARKWCESNAGGASFVQSSWLLTADYLPFGGFQSYWNDWLPMCGSDSLAASTIELPNGPLAAVQSLTYVGTDGLPHALDPSAYRVSPGIPGQIQPAYGTFWPFMLPEIAAVQIAYTTGPAPDTLQTVQSAMLLLIGFLNGNRSADATMPAQLDRILDPVRIYGYS